MSASWRARAKRWPRSSSRPNSVMAETTAAVERGVEQRTIAKISWRLLPLIVLIYFVAYIDRTNVGFAAIGMNKDLGFTAYMYGWGAGIFFIGYFLFEVPSNVILHRVGARVWIARIMITWGVASGAMMFITGFRSFLLVRFLLGVAEAGFFPGVLLYFTYWFPAVYRARVVAALYLAAPGSNAAAAMISGTILQLDGLWGIAGWKWVFLLESLPAVLLAPVVLVRSPPRTAMAHRDLVGGRRVRARRRRRYLQPLLGDRGAVGRRHRPLRAQTVFLAAAVDVSVRDGRRRRHRADQFDRQSRRVRRSLHRRMDQGQHAAVRRGAVFSRRLCAA